MKTIKQIIQEEAKAAGLSYETLIDYNNTLRVISVRRKAMYRAHKETDKTFTQIARVFKRDHTTIISGINYEKRRISFCDPSNNPN
jgi:chromosomal replication initiation ATPase DnaA